MSGTYDASSPSPGSDASATSSQDALKNMMRRQGLLDLDRAIASIDEIAARVEEREADEDADPDDVAHLERITSADGAPLEYRSLNRRVGEGRLTWQDFLRRPQDHARGVALLGELTWARLDDVRTMAAEQPSAERDHR